MTKTTARVKSPITTNHLYIETSVPMSFINAAALWALHIGTGKKETEKEKGVSYRLNSNI